MEIIAIDPDVSLSGVATVNTRDGGLHIDKLNFYDALRYISARYDECEKRGEALKVVIEAGWMNRSNWHLLRTDSRQVIAAKGVAQGRNEQVSRLFGDICKGLGIDYEFRRPLSKIWRGKDRKITHQELERLIGRKLPRTNQDMRDAALLAWVEAGF